MSAGPVSAAAPRHFSRLSLAAITLVILTMIGVGAYLLVARGRAIESVAVLPFINVGSSPDTEYLSDGLAESLINSLSRLPRLIVTSRDSAFRYKRRDISAQVAGQELKVQAVLTGQVVQRGENLVINVELVDVRNNSHLWGEQYQPKLSNLLQVQADIAKEISEKLRLALTGDEQKRLTKRYTENAEAYRLYQLGRYHWNKRTGPDFKAAIDYFQQAISQDANYALGYTGLAEAWMLLGNYGVLPAQESYPKAKEAATKALLLDDDLAEGHTALGFIKQDYDWDWPGAEREFHRALVLNPNDANAHFLYGGYLMLVGRPNDGLAETRQALALDPTSLPINTNLGWYLYFAGQLDQALEQFRETLKLDPNFRNAHNKLRDVYVQKGMFEQAITEYQKALSLNPDSKDILGRLGYAFAVAGRRTEALKILAELIEPAKRGAVSPASVAQIYACLGEKDEAFAWLERAYQERNPQLSFLKVSPKFNCLRSDPRFNDLLRRIGLTP